VTPAPEATRTLTAKGRQTRAAIEQAARKLFAERGFHGTTLADITSAAGKSAAVFYRYFADKEDLLAALAESFLHDIVTPSGLSVDLPDSPPQAGGGTPSRSAARGRAPTDADNFFTSVVTGYWNMFKQNIGIMIAVAQLAATQPRFAAVQNEFRRFGMDIVAASVLRAQEQGYASELNPEHIAAAIALLFENFTTVFVTPPGPGSLSIEISDEDAIATLSTVWKKTLYGA
jgi:AcrR family transcriptional regulator